MSSQSQPPMTTFPPSRSDAYTVKQTKIEGNVRNYGRSRTCHGLKGCSIVICDSSSTTMARQTDTRDPAELYYDGMQRPCQCR